MNLKFTSVWITLSALLVIYSVCVAARPSHEEWSDEGDFEIDEEDEDDDDGYYRPPIPPLPTHIVVSDGIDETHVQSLQSTVEYLEKFVRKFIKPHLDPHLPEDYFPDWLAKPTKHPATEIISGIPEEPVFGLSEIPMESETTIPEQPVAEAAQPEVDPPKPELDLVKPDLESAKPEPVLAKPDLEPAKPEVEPAKPELEPTKPELDPIKPDQEPANSELGPVLQELQAIKPEQEPTQPEPELSNPELQLVKPEPEPLNPQLEPQLEPEVKPIVADVNLAETEVLPDLIAAEAEKEVIPEIEAEVSKTPDAIILEPEIVKPTISDLTTASPQVERSTTIASEVADNPEPVPAPPVQQSITADTTDKPIDTAIIQEEKLPLTEVVVQEPEQIQIVETVTPGEELKQPDETTPVPLAEMILSSSPDMMAALVSPAPLVAAGQAESPIGEEITITPETDKQVVEQVVDQIVEQAVDQVVEQAVDQVVEQVAEPEPTNIIGETSIQKPIEMLADNTAAVTAPLEQETPLTLEGSQDIIAQTVQEQTSPSPLHAADEIIPPTISEPIVETPPVVADLLTDIPMETTEPQASPSEIIEVVQPASEIEYSTTTAATIIENPPTPTTSSTLPPDLFIGEYETYAGEEALAMDQIDPMLAESYPPPILVGSESIDPAVTESFPPPIVVGTDTMDPAAMESFPPPIVVGTEAIDPAFAESFPPPIVVGTETIDPDLMESYPPPILVGTESFDPMMGEPLRQPSLNAPPMSSNYPSSVPSQRPPAYPMQFLQPSHPAEIPPDHVETVAELPQEPPLIQMLLLEERVHPSARGLPDERKETPVLTCHNCTIRIACTDCVKFRPDLVLTDPGAFPITITTPGLEITADPNIHAILANYSETISTRAGKDFMLEMSHVDATINGNEVTVEATSETELATAARQEGMLMPRAKGPALNEKANLKADVPLIVDEPVPIEIPVSRAHMAPPVPNRESVAGSTRALPVDPDIVLSSLLKRPKAGVLRRRR